MTTRSHLIKLAASLDDRKEDSFQHRSNSEQAADLRPGDVHVWRIILDVAPTDLIALEKVLSMEEQLRASRFANKQLADRWIAARGALRTILSGYAGTAPESLILKSDARGKPNLAIVNPPLSFSLSHTENVAFVAVSAGICVGIDAEVLRADIEWDKIGSQFCTPAEADEIKSLTPERRNLAYFVCWTRKEAYVKAVGIGLRAALDKLRVSVRPEEPPKLLWVEGRPDEPPCWSVYDLGEPALAVALAVKSSKATTVKRFMFSVPLLSTT